MPRHADDPRSVQVWALAVDDKTNILVLKDGMFYAGQLTFGEGAAFIKRMEAGGDPCDDLGAKCPQANLDDVTRVVADDKGYLRLESQGQTLLKVCLKSEGIKVVEAVQDLKGAGWEVDTHSKTRVGSALVSLVIGVLLGAAMVWAYYGIVSGKIDRIHWLAALLVNSLGPWVLLLIGALVFLGGMAGFGYYLTHPAEIWTLEEE
jgi:hypothetical protein